MFHVLGVQRAQRLTSPDVLANIEITVPPPVGSLYQPANVWVVVSAKFEIEVSVPYVCDVGFGLLTPFVLL